MPEGLCGGELGDGGVDVAEEGFGGGVEGVAIGGCEGLLVGSDGGWMGWRRRVWSVAGDGGRRVGGRWRGRKERMERTCVRKREM